MSMKNNFKTELLAPAGKWESLVAAVQNGADAVYLGEQSFSARKNAANFSWEQIEEAVKLLLEGIGEDVNREGLRETPNRIARMYEEIFAGMDESAQVHLSKTFSSTGSEMVIEKDIVFYSTCEHHLMPFYGKAHVAYIPDGKVVGLSKLARCVEVYAKRPQIQEQMTADVAERHG